MMTTTNNIMAANAENVTALKSGQNVKDDIRPMFNLEKKTRKGPCASRGSERHSIPFTRQSMHKLPGHVDL